MGWRAAWLAALSSRGSSNKERAARAAEQREGRLCLSPLGQDQKPLVAEDASASLFSLPPT